jgi:hypothetical protein
VTKSRRTKFCLEEGELTQKMKEKLERQLLYIFVAKF